MLLPGWGSSAALAVASLPGLACAAAVRRTWKRQSFKHLRRQLIFREPASGNYLEALDLPPVGRAHLEPTSASGHHDS